MHFVLSDVIKYIPLEITRFCLFSHKKVRKMKIEKRDKSERRAETEVQENGNWCCETSLSIIVYCTLFSFSLVWNDLDSKTVNKVLFLLLLFVFLLVCRIDRHRHPVTKQQRRRKRRSKAGLTPLLMKRGERRRRRSWKSTRRRAENTKRNMGKVRRRNRRRGNKNHLPPPPPRPAPVNRQTVTETHAWHGAQGIPLLSFIPWKRRFADIVGTWHPTSSGTSVIYKNRDLQRRRRSKSWHRDESEKCLAEGGAQSQGTCSDILFHFPSRPTVTSHLVFVVCRRILGGAWCTGWAVHGKTLSLSVSTRCPLSLGPFLHFYHHVLLNWIMWEQISFYCLNS